MNKSGSFLNYLGSLVVGLIMAHPIPTWAQSCRLDTVIAPSSEMRRFSSLDLGVSLEIPNNYRSILRNSGHITFHDPGTFEFIQCLIRRGQYGEVPPHVTLEAHRVAQSGGELREIVRRKRPWLDYYNPEYRSVNISGYPAIQYEYVHEIYPISVFNISFLSGDHQTLLTLSGPAQHPILDNALNTLELSPLLP